MDRKYTRHLICALSLAAGLPFGLFFEVLPLFMRQANLSLTVIGLAGFAQLPWILKPLWAPLVDRTGNLSRWLSTVAVGLAFALGGLAFLAPAPKLLPLCACLLLLSAASASQDLVIDATFVNFTRRQRLSLAEVNALSAWRMAAYKVAVMGGSGLMLAAASTAGWRPAFAGCAVVAGVGGTALARALASLNLDPPPVAKFAEGEPLGEVVAQGEWNWASFGRTLAQWLAAPHMPQVLAFVFLYKLTLCCLGPMGKPFWLDHGASALQLGAATGALALGGALAGVAMASYALRHFPLAATLTVGSLLESATALLYLTAQLTGALGLLAPTLLLEGTAQGMTTTLLLTVLARLCEPRQAATQFAVLSALFGLTRVTGGFVGGALATYCGWTGFLCLLPVLALPALAFLKPLELRLNARP